MAANAAHCVRQPGIEESRDGAAFHRVGATEGRFRFLASLCLLLPNRSFAWGRNGHRLVISKAVETLPSTSVIFRGQSRDPLSARYRSSGRHARLLRSAIIISSSSTIRTIPVRGPARNYKAAVTKFGKAKLDANGLLPWQIGVYSEKLTEAMKAGKWEEAKLYAAILANYVAEAHDPFDTTDNFDGRLSAQPVSTNASGPR